MTRIRRWLLPLSWIYGLAVDIRNALFEMGVLPSVSYDIPIINVGNITVGGTGKTPHVEYLIRLLSGRYRVAVLSRGYRRRTSGYLLSSATSTMEEIGDEPWQ
ncbi:MAG: tetraacyldisaccharide 4'-kinase, partial [Victivallales bacterium]|nr:tetraacyldisaccharide 4'-kinase [Victivallales bacterium]